jgi:hypothetical protein
MEVWTPQTGEVVLEQGPRDTAEQRRRHAFALIGTGEWAGGVAELRDMIRSEQDAPWVGDARLAIARALLGAGKYRQAFDELQDLTPAGASSELAAMARDLQFGIARAAARDDIDGALPMYDHLVDSAKPEDSAYARKEKADALFGAGRYLDAEDQYLDVATIMPQNEWVPYCWYKAADCEWQLAQWLGLGSDRVGGAARLLSDFAAKYPDSPYRQEAQQKVDQARRKQAEMCRQVAVFYTESKRRSWAAVGYLDYIRQEFADTAEAAWAAEQLEQSRKGALAPLRGSFRELPLPGVQTQPAAQATPPSPPARTADE